MGLLAELSLRGKKVLLIGGGKQALRKAKKLQKQGAFLTAVASSFLEGFFTICDRVLTQSYDRSLITGSFLVIAATDNPELNHQIVQDANEQGALSMSIQADENATVHSVGSREFEGITAAVSTHGAYPALDSLLLDCWQDSSSTLIKKLPVLGELRKKILSTSLSAEGKREILRSLPMWEERTLTGLLRATQQGMLLIPVWHGTASPQSMKTEVFPFSGEMETRFSPIPVCEAFLSGKMRDKLSDRGIWIPLLKEILDLAEGLGISQIVLQPILLTKGVYYQQMVSCAQEHEKVHISIGEPLIKDAKDAGMLFSCLRTGESGEQILYVSHGFEEELQKALRESLRPMESLALIGEDLPVLSKEYPVRVIPLLMLIGFHANRDLFEGEHSFCIRLQQKGFVVRPEQVGLMERANVHKLFLDKAKI